MRDNKGRFVHGHTPIPSRDSKTGMFTKKVVSPISEIAVPGFPVISPPAPAPPPPEIKPSVELSVDNLLSKSEDFKDESVASLIDVPTVVKPILNEDLLKTPIEKCHTVTLSTEDKDKDKDTNTTYKPNRYRKRWDW